MVLQPCIVLKCVIIIYLLQPVDFVQVLESDLSYEIVFALKCSYRLFIYVNLKMLCSM